MLTALTSLTALIALTAAAQSPVSYTAEDGAVIQGDLYGAGTRGVILAHGGRYNKESWAPQARMLAASGFQVLAIDFRGYGRSVGPGGSDPLSAPLYLDILGAVRYLKDRGAESIAVVGGSMGGTAAAVAAARSMPGTIDRLVLLASPTGDVPEATWGCKLFIAAEGDTTASGTPRLVRIREQYERAPDPKRLIVVPGTAHAQALFDTPDGMMVLNEIRQFLDAPQC